MTHAAIPILTSVGELADRSDAWIVDIWGVMHNGARAFLPACEACRRMRARGGTVALLSNAPRPFRDVIRHLEGLGVPRDAYDFGLTSGDATRGLIADAVRAGTGRPLLHIGPPRDLGLFEGLGVEMGTAASAQLVVCSGLYDDTKETPATYGPLFEQLLARRVPMICANPDIKVERGNTLVYCAGALAAEYERMGGEVAYAGKPHLPIYQRMLAELARARGEPVPRERILAIGDGLETDLAGAHRAGLASLFISSAVHVPGRLDDEVLRALFAERPIAPVAAMHGLAW